MAYPKMDFDNPKSALEQELDRAKQAGNYNAGAFDGRVVRELDRLINSSIAIVEDYFKKVDENFAVAKKTMDEMEALIKKQGKKLTDSDARVIDTMARTLERCANVMTETSQESMKALGEFRAGWPAKWRPLVSKPTLIDPFIARRKQSIDEGQQKEAMRARAREYVKRATDLNKQAQQTVTRGASLAQDEGKEIGQFQADVKHYSDLLADFIKKVGNSFDPVLRLDLKKKLNPDQQKMYDEALKQAQLKTKEARGNLKTFTIKVESFKKTAVQFSDGNRKTAEKVYAVAAKALKQAETDAKKIAGTESKAIKALETIKKLK